MDSDPSELVVPVATVDKLVSELVVVVARPVTAVDRLWVVVDSEDEIAVARLLTATTAVDRELMTVVLPAAMAALNDAVRLSSVVDRLVTCADKLDFAAVTKPVAIDVAALFVVTSNVLNVVVTRFWPRTPTIKSFASVAPTRCAVAMSTGGTLATIWSCTF